MSLLHQRLFLNLKETLRYPSKSPNFLPKGTDENME